MRRLLIAPFLGASLLIAGPAFAATGTHSEVGPGHSSDFSSAGPSSQQLSQSARDKLVGDVASEPIQLAYHDRNPLWWLQVGIGDRWDDDDRWRHDRSWKKDRWHRNHPWYKRHDWNKGRWNQHSRRWDRDRDWDRRHRHWDNDWDDDWDDDDWRRHRHRDRDHDRDYRWGDDRRDR